MITEINANPEDWKKDVYIASKLGVDYDDEANEIVSYDTPNVEPYKFNYQPVSTDAEIAEFGEKASVMKKAVIPISYKGMFKEFDVAYSSIVSSIQDVKANHVTSSGKSNCFAEYDMEGNLIKQFNYTSKKYAYRVFKYDFKNIWFK